MFKSTVIFVRHSHFHSVYSSRYTRVFVVKGRKSTITREQVNRRKQLNFAIAASFDITFEYSRCNLRVNFTRHCHRFDYDATNTSGCVKDSLHRSHVTTVRNQWQLMRDLTVASPQEFDR